MKDEMTPEEFAPIAEAMKSLPSFAPSPHFADKVMARVRVASPARHPAVAHPRAVPAPAPIFAPERTRPAVPPAHYYPRSIPARLTAVALLATTSVTISLVALVAIFNVDLFVFIARVFGEGAIGFLASLGADATVTATSTAASTATALGTATGAAVVGSFALGVVAATAGLRAAASANRKAA
ncbi:MAG TPA: hypothetical protein VM939_08530 [Gemmatimonadaceae bacterium]|nr:hypothetical protein [Gemmatimonadaceae bacterium]